MSSQWVFVDSERLIVILDLDFEIPQARKWHISGSRSQFLPPSEPKDSNEVQRQQHKKMS